MAHGRLRRLVTRRRLKRVGLVLCVFVLGVYVASAWYQTTWRVNKPNQDARISLGHGGLRYIRYDFDRPTLALIKELLRYWPADNPSIDLRPRWRTHKFIRPSSGGPYTEAFLPLWIPLLLIAAPTARLWYTDRCAKPWQCPRCRYDLRGIEGGVCPECGVTIGRSARGNSPAI